MHIADHSRRKDRGVHLLESPDDEAWIEQGKVLHSRSRLGQMRQEDPILPAQARAAPGTLKKEGIALNNVDFLFEDPNCDPSVFKDKQRFLHGIPASPVIIKQSSPDAMRDDTPLMEWVDLIFSFNPSVLKEILDDGTIDENRKSSNNGNGRDASSRR
jgi:hypothetical protein